LFVCLFDKTEQKPTRTVFDLEREFLENGGNAEIRKISTTNQKSTKPEFPKDPAKCGGIFGKFWFCGFFGIFGKFWFCGNLVRISRV